jgi:Hydantoinase/oxoprolinase N-terminal region
LPVTVALDIGGTFTDLVCYDSTTRTLGHGKSATTPARLIEGIAQTLAKADVNLADVVDFVHGSTIAINTVSAVRVHGADWLGGRHPGSYPAQVEVTLRGGTAVAFLSDRRSPAPGWDWDSVLSKAKAVAAHAGPRAAMDRLRDATARSSDADDLLRNLPTVLDAGCL